MLVEKLNSCNSDAERQVTLIKLVVDKALVFFVYDMALVSSQGNPYMIFPHVLEY